MVSEVQMVEIIINTTNKPLANHKKRTKREIIETVELNYNTRNKLKVSQRSKFPINL